MLFGQPGSLGGSRETRRIMLFGVFLFLALGYYLYVSVTAPPVEPPSIQREAAAGKEYVPTTRPPALQVSGFPEASAAEGAAPDAPEPEESGAEEPEAAEPEAAGDEKPTPVVVDPDVDMSVFEPAGVRDKTMTIEKNFLFELLEKVQKMSPEELKAAAQEVEFTTFFNDPESWRGKVLRVQGMIRRIVKREPEKLPAGIDVLYEAQLTDKDAYWYYVFITEKPEFGVDALVELDGVFMKIHAYETRNRTKLFAPLLICKGFRQAVVAPWEDYHTIGWGVLVLLILGAAGAIFIYQGQKRDSEAVSLKVEQKRLDRARAWAETRKGAGGDVPDDGGGNEPAENEGPGQEDPGQGEGEKEQGEG